MACNSANSLYINESLYINTILSNGGDLVSTWITKLEAHAEDVATLVNNAANL